jgi:hypothetical protein
MARTGPDPEGMQAQWHHFAEFVRRALHAAADQVEPQEDGLEPIRAQIPLGSGRPARPPARRRRHRRGGGRDARRNGPRGSYRN